MKYLKIDEPFKAQMREGEIPVPGEGEALLPFL